MKKKTVLSAKQQREIQESIKNKVLSEWENGNVCYQTVDGIVMMPHEWFIQQPLEGVLYDMNRDEAAILSQLENTRWVNDFALVKLLKYYYKRCLELESKK